MMAKIKRYWAWVKKRMKEKSTWAGILIVVGTSIGKDLNWIHTMGSGIGFIFFGGSLFAYQEDHKDDEDDSPPPINEG